MNSTTFDRDAFYEEVYEVVAQIPFGKVSTYGEVASLAGRPQGARLAGQALRNAPQGRMIPCHRVVNVAGRLVPGWTGQKALLVQEGIAFRSNGCVDMLKHMWRPE